MISSFHAHCSAITTNVHVPWSLIPPLHTVAASTVPCPGQRAVSGHHVLPIEARSHVTGRPPDPLTHTESHRRGGVVILDQLVAAASLVEGLKMHQVLLVLLSLDVPHNRIKRCTVFAAPRAVTAAQSRRNCPRASSHVAFSTTYSITFSGQVLPDMEHAAPLCHHPPSPLPPKHRPVIFFLSMNQRQIREIC